MEHEIYKEGRRQSGATNVILLLFAGLFVFAGVLGLIIPIIPGLLFLALAAVLVIKVFPSVRRMLGNPAFLARTERRVDAMGDLGWSGRARLAGLMVLDALAEVMSAAVGLVRRLAARNRR